MTTTRGAGPSAGRTARLGRTFALVAIGILAWRAPALASHMDTVEPGDTIVLENPHVGGGCKQVAIDFLALCAPGTIGDIDPARPLRSRVAVTPPASSFRRAAAVFYQYNDIEVDAGNRPETLLTAQVSGAVDIRGFLVLIGLGQVEAKVVAKVIDVTDDPDNGVVVKTHTIAKYEEQASFQALSGANIGIEGGAPYLGVDTGGLFNFSLEMKKQVVRDSFGFGFDVLVRRGHIYRVQLELESSAKCGSVCAMAAARFFSIGEEVLPPRLVDPELWSAAIGLDAIPLPNFTIGSGGFKIFQNAVERNCSDTNGDDSCSALELLGTFGFPTSVGGVVGRIVDKLGFGPGGANDEVLGFPGVDVTRLSFTVQEDEIEAIEDAAIEDKVAACISTVRLYLPAEFGGKLERVLGLVESLIEQSAMAGLDTGRAADYVLDARFDLMDGNYKRSYRNACKAYDALANFATGASHS